MYNIHPTDFLIFSFDREVSQSKVLFQCPRLNVHPLILNYLLIQIVIQVLVQRLNFSTYKCFVSIFLIVIFSQILIITL